MIHYFILAVRLFVHLRSSPVHFHIHGQMVLDLALVSVSKGQTGRRDPPEVLSSRPVCVNLKSISILQAMQSVLQDQVIWQDRDALFSDDSCTKMLQVHRLTARLDINRALPLWPQSPYHYREYLFFLRVDSTIQDN